ncbi:MAG: cation diffusion facilitator family transporter [Parvibaculum sp.]|uniref:cation diffusion facilitator family transporter n=1 Tax=Parvibaculum sp. TaxID=2024848 RepID=UPI00272776A1|nr:cation diffusion facilitator family transporter [Parvibaculum sp.]MDO8839809.1 cation diffusion facilitator family transporter [Parvibaculum sp.]
MTVHRHSDHQHDHSHANERRVFFAMWLTGTFMIVEFAGGILSGSLALIADAGHMLTDTGALMLAWLATRLARKPADIARSYGYGRAETLAAFTNGIVMLVLVGWILFEAATRIMEPRDILAGPMLAVAIAGLAVNIVALKLLHGGDGNLNMRGAALHVMGDLLGSVAAIAAAIVILTTGFMAIDPILSVLVALLILRSAASIIREAAHVLMEGSPEGADGVGIAGDLMAEVPGLADVHHVHAWSLASDRKVATLHARLAPDTDPGVALAAIKARLASRFGIGHATVQIEAADCPDDADHRGH